MPAALSSARSGPELRRGVDRGLHLLLVGDVGLHVQAADLRRHRAAPLFVEVDEHAARAELRRARRAEASPIPEAPPVMIAAAPSTSMARDITQERGTRLRDCPDGERDRRADAEGQLAGAVLRPRVRGRGDHVQRRGERQPGARGDRRRVGVVRRGVAHLAGDHVLRELVRDRRRPPPVPRGRADAVAHTGVARGRRRPRSQSRARVGVVRAARDRRRSGSCTGATPAATSRTRRSRPCAGTSTSSPHCPCWSRRSSRAGAGRALGVAIVLVAIPALGCRVGGLAGATPLDEAHLVERLGLLTIIVIGESFVKVSLVVSDGHLDGIDVLVLVALFVAVFAIWWAYFDDIPEAGIRDGVAASIGVAARPPLVPALPDRGRDRLREVAAARDRGRVHRRALAPRRRALRRGAARAPGLIGACTRRVPQRQLLAAVRDRAPRLGARDPELASARPRPRDRASRCRPSR